MSFTTPSIAKEVVAFAQNYNYHANLGQRLKTPAPDRINRFLNRHFNAYGRGHQKGFHFIEDGIYLYSMTSRRSLDGIFTVSQDFYIPILVPKDSEETVHIQIPIINKKDLIKAYRNIVGHFNYHLIAKTTISTTEGYQICVAGLSRCLQQ